MLTKSEAPRLGAAYYPENWPSECIDNDIRLMREAGIRIVKLAEKAWSVIEPAKGVFDFGWLHNVIDKLNTAGIPVLLCIPTSDPPAWLAEDLLSVHCCANDPVFLDCSRRLTEKMADEFAARPGIAGWQIESPLLQNDCFCSHCADQFRQFLQNKYESMDRLREAWSLKLWNAEYKSFSQIPVPEGRNGYPLPLTADWDDFQSNSRAAFESGLTAILYQHGVAAPIGTCSHAAASYNYSDSYTGKDVHFNIINADIDPVGDSLHKSAFWLDYIRSINLCPYWRTNVPAILNSAASPADHTEHGCSYVNSWLAFALGAQACIFKSWRSDRNELEQNSVISTSGRPLPVFSEISDIAREIKKAKKILQYSYNKPSELAIHLSRNAASAFGTQAFAGALDGFGGYENAVCDGVYKPIIESQLRPDIIDPSAPLDPYRVVVSAFLPDIDEGNVRSRIHGWMESGGIWVAGPFTDILDSSGLKFIESPYGSLEAWAGVYAKYRLPANRQEYNAVTKRGAGLTGSIWYDGFETCEGTESLAEYINGPLKGLSAIAFRPFGSGGIILMGTLPEPGAFGRMMLEICARAGIQPVAKADRNLLVIPRCGRNENMLVCIEYMNRPATIWLEKPMRDVLTGRIKRGEVNAAPNSVMVLAGGGQFGDSEKQ